MQPVQQAEDMRCKCVSTVCEYQANSSMRQTHPTGSSLVLQPCSPPLFALKPQVTDEATTTPNSMSYHYVICEMYSHPGYACRQVPVPPS